MTPIQPKSTVKERFTTMVHRLVLSQGRTTSPTLETTENGEDLLSSQGTCKETTLTNSGLLHHSAELHEALQEVPPEDSAVHQEAHLVLSEEDITSLKADSHKDLRSIIMIDQDFMRAPDNSEWTKGEVSTSNLSTRKAMTKLNGREWSDSIDTKRSSGISATDLKASLKKWLHATEQPKRV